MECLGISESSRSTALKLSWKKEWTVFRVDCLPESFAKRNRSSAIDKNKGLEDNSNIPFPLKLHAMLDDAEPNGFEHIVCWEQDGKAFKVHDPGKFVDAVLSRYLNQSRYKSFQRQLNIYGFSRVARGRDKGLCHHKLLVRGQPSLCAGMQRIKIKESSLVEPQLILSSQEEARTDDSDESSQDGESFVTSDEGEALFDTAVFEGKSFYLVEEGKDEVKSPHPETESSSSSTSILAKATSPPEEVSSNCRSDSFPWKLHDMLDQVEKAGDDHIVSWEHDGRALKVHKPKEFAQKLLPIYFLHSKKWQSFQRQLNLYGFIRVARGPQKGMYLHKFFVRGQRSLCRSITRPR
jgi:hypothetical protein